MTLFVYLLYGRSPAAERELRYAWETLRAEGGRGGRRFSGEEESAPSSRAQGSDPAAPPTADGAEASGRSRADGGAGVTDGLDRFPALAMTEYVVLYTDRPLDFADVATVDVGPLLAAAGEYRHSVKPRVLADALRRFGQHVVLLDLDGFVRPGFAREVENALADGAAMNFFVRRDPYPFFPDFQTQLPHLGAYRLDREHARMLNSGLVAVSPKHLPLVEDAIVLIERLWAAGLHKHDIEQFALAETLRLGAVKIALIDKTFEHYCARWARRYMRRRLRRRAPNARIPYSKARVRLFKAYWTLRLAMRNARRSWRGRWRKT